MTNVLEKEPIELPSELEELYSVMLFVAGDNDDHQFDRDSRKVFYDENKEKKHCCRKMIEAEQYIGTL